MSDVRSKPAIGVIFHPKFAPVTLPEYTRRAESAGFDELWLWDDCFTPGAFTSAAIALSATQRLKVGIGLIPATAYNPLFAAMEITTLALAFPNRILPGFGHGYGPWMVQIGSAPKSSLTALKETVTAVRQLLQGEMVTMPGDQVHLDRVQMQQTAADPPPLYIGAIRPKTLQLAGTVGDGTILDAMSSPAYVRWALKHIRTGMAESGRSHHRVVVYVDAKVNPDGDLARAAVRQTFAGRLPWNDAKLNALGIKDEVDTFVQTYGANGVAERMPDEWVNAFSAAGTPQQAASAVNRLFDAGADSVVLQPLDGDPACLDEYIRYLMPLLKPKK